MKMGGIKQGGEGGQRWEKTTKMGLWDVALKRLDIGHSPRLFFPCLSAHTYRKITHSLPILKVS